ncbi:MAG: calcium/sodium antiporter [Clostridium sp.]|nr:calcium/sodium antiporter [Clostridium sp.]MCM1173221.1 calcium/sodium antiporter [Clostridium sp.]MCM1209449.1 calcium/sodium antiporter [Ruminococcus sp.]
MEILLQIILMAVGFALLIKGADLFVDGASGIAARLGIPQLVIGLTIVAMGTSAPEAAVSISAALKGNAEITIGNIVGSNILNIFIILGITSVIISVKVAASTVKYELPFMIAITAVLLLFGYTGGNITFFEGILLWFLFILYLAYLFVMAKRNKEEIDDKKEEKPLWKLILFILLGLFMIVFGSDISVDGASAIASAVGISERFIGLTIVALGTSLPELVTSIAAARKGKADIAIGNIVGSNIFNILFVVGTTSLITPVVFADNFIIDTAIAIFAGILLLVGVLRKKELNRATGILMLVCYGAYFIYLI